MKFRSNTIFVFAFFSAWFLLINPINAANILGVCESGSSAAGCSPNKIYFPCYEKTAGVGRFVYRIDPGALGDLTASQAFNDAEDMLEMWEDVASINFVRAGNGLISEDVDSTNYSPYLDPAEPLGYSPIIFDEQGEIIENYFGRGSRAVVLGFAGAVFYNTDDSSGAILSIDESQSLYNGYLFDLDNVSGTFDEMHTEFKTTILHEFAHMIGIDHSQGGEVDHFFGSATNLENFPVMFPISANPLIALQKDDIAAVNLCYPSSSHSSSTGKISGTLKKSNGKAIRSANVIAYNIDDPLVEVISSASDHRGQNNGSFLLSGLSPGEYVIKVEPVHYEFSGGSSVGIYAPGTSDSIPTGFYLGPQQGVLLVEDIDDALEDAERITVTAGETVSGVEIVNSGAEINDESATFRLGGSAVKRVHLLGLTESINVKLKIKRKGAGLRNLSISTNYPQLVTFPKGDTLKLGKRKKAKKVVIEIASFADFVDVVDGFESSNGADIELTVTDLDTGYVNSSETITVF